MRRRIRPDQKVWTSADLPPHLAEYDPLTWGCDCGLPFCHPMRCQAVASYWQQHRAWLSAHDVDVVAELRAQVAARLHGLRDVT